MERAKKDCLPRTHVAVKTERGKLGDLNHY